MKLAYYILGLGSVFVLLGFLAKSARLLQVIGIVLAVIGLMANFASAPNYSFLFIIIIGCNLLSIACFGYLFRAGRISTFAIFPVILIIYTSADVALRTCLGMRALDFVMR